MHIIISRITVLGIRWDPEPTFEYTSFFWEGEWAARCTACGLSAVAVSCAVWDAESGGSRVGYHVSHGGTHWCHLANTTEPSMCGSDAALCQITLATRYGRPM